MKNLAVQFILILIISSILLSTAALEQEGAYAQISPRTTNATILSGNNDVNSQGGLQNQSINYFDGSSGYLVYPTTTTDNNIMATTGQQQQKLPAVVMIHEWWGVNDNIKDMANELASEG